MPVTIGLGAGIIGAVGKLFGRHSANQKLEQLKKLDPTYTRNPMVDQRLGLANTLLNARSPGAVAAEQNIATNTATATSNAERGATDASQFLAAGGAIQGAANEAYGKLDENENADYQRRYANQVGAQEASINEDDKVYNDKIRRFGDMAQIGGAQSENNTNGWQDVSNLGFGLADFGINGGFQNLMRKRQAALAPTTP